MDSGQRLSSRSSLSRLHPQPDFINEALPGFLLFLLPLCVPCPQAQETQHVHFIDFLHTPAVLHQFVVGGIDVFRQGQASCRIVTSGFSASARICSASCTTGIVAGRIPEAPSLAELRTKSNNPNLVSRLGLFGGGEGGIRTHVPLQAN